MESVLIVGNTHYSTLLLEYIRDLNNISVEGFVVDKEYIFDRFISGLPVLSFDELIARYPSADYKLILGIGYSCNGKLKQEIYQRCKQYGYNFINYIHPAAQVHAASIGEANVFFENVIIQKRAMIGNGNLFFSGSVLMHDSHVGDFNSFCANSVINGSVKIHNCSFFGANATIRDAVEIGSHVIIGAGAYVNETIIDDAAVLPARSHIIDQGSVIYSKSI